MKTNIYILLLLTGTFIVPQWGMASFALSDVVKRSSIVLVGKIEKIEKSKLTLACDVAVIRVMEILKNNQTNVLITVGQTIPLSMSSVRMKRINPEAISFDLYQEGVWILDYKYGYYWATDPKDYQPLSEIESIQEMINEEIVIPAASNCPVCKGYHDNPNELTIPCNEADKNRHIDLCGSFECKFIEVSLDNKIIYKGTLYPTGREPQIKYVSIPLTTDARCELQIKIDNESLVSG